MCNKSSRGAAATGRKSWVYNLCTANGKSTGQLQSRLTLCKLLLRASSLGLLQFIVNLLAALEGLVTSQRVLLQLLQGHILQSLLVASLQVDGWRCIGLDGLIPS